jgi:hypothetical protein
MMKRHKSLLVTLVVIMSIFVFHHGVFAKIPEPDNIIYGIAGQGVDTITLKVNGQVIASYTMGSNPDAGNNYILRVPLDALDPQESGTARPGDEAEIYVDGVLATLEPVIIGERGSIQEIHLATEDSDADGLSDTEELALGTNPHNADTDGDGLSDYYEANNGTSPLLYDTDGDGYSDGYEVSADTNPMDENEMPVIYVDIGNSGYEDGTKDNPYNTVNEGINAAPDKYTVLVAMGIYEEGVIIDKDIRLIGESPSTTIIDAGAATDAIYYDYLAGEVSCIEGFTIRNSDNGIKCANGTSLLICNNIITQIATSGIICGDSSTARIINNTISDNADATAIQCSSSDITIVNNIISSNHIGIDCNAGADPRIDYNNVWNNSGGDYIDCIAGIHDISDDPSFVDIANGNFHLANGSPCIDAGDPVETLTEDYAGGSSLMVDEVTNIAIGDRIWITDGGNIETDILITVLSSAIEIQGEFMNDYLVADGTNIFTDTSDAYREPEPGNYRIDMGAYGNTAEAGPALQYCEGDFDGDGDVDGSDLAVFSADFGRTDCVDDCEGDFDSDGDVDGSDLAIFSADFGRTDCPVSE